MKMETKRIFHVISNKFNVDTLYCHRSNDVISYFPNNNNMYHIFNRINKESWLEKNSTLRPYMQDANSLRGKGKGKVYPRTGPDGLEGE
jgi:hypothetical protein